ncbi:MAG: polysaccharide export protein [Candidatus Omnitrophica bacterium]|nr:polysaccharide export protein [Candidatus Omnitrophota bacterium]MDE2222909.1 polysaccharide export protein [Candidatus Omnitrophota bacterium]
MKKYFLLICLLVLTGIPAAQAQADKEGTLKQVMSPSEYKGFEASQAYAEQNSHYTLGPTDIVTITVQRHPEVSGDYTINSEGKIQYEFVGDIKVAGLTKKELTDKVVKKLSTYIINPEVNIKISGYNSKVVYVIGEVGMPGRIQMHGDTITVRQALLDAGLPLLSASTKGARLFTPSNSGKVAMKRVNVYALLYEGDLRQNFTMKSGDTLYIPATILAKAMRVISPVTQPISTTAGAAGAARYGAGI